MATVRRSPSARSRTLTRLLVSGPLAGEPTADPASGRVTSAPFKAVYRSTGITHRRG
ncbi:hypothetical protein ACFCZ1_04445 [Streptomyces sp. NPDC056224]|uniref:hypothetical protein n=1 Tax=Streptomyces sp. NPDC056224 TaxID=3345750 RepID=UPI0035E2FECA